MRRAVLDSNAVDPLIDLPNALDTVVDAVRSGALDLLFTHVTVDELAAVPDLNRRSTLLVALISVGRMVPTGFIAWDVSRWGQARWATAAPQVIESLRSGNIDHTRDALIAETAAVEGCALVTNERRLTGRARERGVEVLTTLDLLAEIGFQPHI
jgi:hypothetical protein